VQNLVLVATMPVLARLFDPAEFGVAGLVYATVAILAPLSSGQYYNGMLLPRKDIAAINMFVLSILLSLVFCGILMVAVLGFRGSLAASTSSPHLWASLLLIIPVLTLGEVALQASRYWALRKTGYRQLFRNNILETAMLVCSQLGAGVAGFGAVGLIAGRLLAVIASLAYFAAYAMKTTGGRFLWVVRFRYMRVLSKHYYQFPAYNMPNVIIYSAGPQIVSMLFGVLFSVKSVGFYWMAYRVLLRPSTLFGDHITRVYYQQAADRIKQHKPLFGYMTKNVAVLAGVTVTPYMIIIFFGETLFSVIFGKEWALAGTYARWMALSSFGMMIAAPARGTATLYRLERFSLVIEIFRLLMTTAAVILSVHFGDDVLAIALYSVIQLLVSLGFVIFGFALARRYDVSPELRPSWELVQ
jgi:O-antigen/teichoic acid export membrane protein